MISVFEKEKYRNITEISVRYDDLDTLGHVNNKTYLSYLEESRINYMIEVLSLNTKTLDFDVVVGRIDIKYISPVFLSDKVSIFTRVSRIGAKSYDFESVITKTDQKGLSVSAFAMVTLVSVDTKTGKSKPNEPKMIDSVLNYETVKPEITA